MWYPLFLAKVSQFYFGIKIEHPTLSSKLYLFPHKLWSDVHHVLRWLMEYNCGSVQNSKLCLFPHKLSSDWHAPCGTALTARIWLWFHAGLWMLPLHRLWSDMHRVVLRWLLEYMVLLWVLSVTSFFMPQALVCCGTALTAWVVFSNQMDVIFLIWLQLIYSKDSPEVLQVRQWRQNKTSYNNNIFLLVCFLDEPYNLKHQDCFLFYITLQTCLLWTFVCTFLCHIKGLWLHTDSGQWGWGSDCQLLGLWYSWPTDVVWQHPVH